MSAEIAAHLVGDYLVQSDGMAQQKLTRSGPAAAHAASYAACFLPLTRDPGRLAFIAATHFVIDRWRLAKYVVWAKNQLAPAQFRYPWPDADGTGYQASKPDWMATWLMIWADNSMHLVCNRLALR